MFPITPEQESSLIPRLQSPAERAVAIIFSIMDLGIPSATAFGVPGQEEVSHELHRFRRSLPEHCIQNHDKTSPILTPLKRHTPKDIHT